MKTAGYNIYLDKDYQNYTLVGKSATTSYRLTGLADGIEECSVRIEPLGEDGSVRNLN